MLSWWGMRVATIAAAALLLVGTATADEPKHQSDPASVEASVARARIYLMGDNQERELFGEDTPYAGFIPHLLSKVAMRSLEQDLYGKFIVQHVVEKTRAPSDFPDPILLHLGDLLDYACLWEFETLLEMGKKDEKGAEKGWLQSPNFFIAPGNHDVVFQGNGTYLGKAGRLYFASLGRDDTGLEGHHNAVCSRGKNYGNAVPVRIQEKVENLRTNVQTKDRYGGATARHREKLPDGSYGAMRWQNTRMLPNSFRCAYLRVKSGAGGIQNPRAAEFCNDVLVYPFYKVSNPQPLEPTQFSVGDAGNLHVSLRGGKSFAVWDEGHLAQRIEVPLLGRNAARVGRVVVILLDTTDWKEAPSWGATVSDSAKGSVEKAQKNAVIGWLDRLATDPSVVAVIFAGHYPLKDLESDTSAWLETMFVKPKVVPLYLSAHTHLGNEDKGSLVDDRNPIQEINVGSLVDNTIHYREVNIEWHDQLRELRIQSVRHDLKLECKESKETQSYGYGRSNAKAYLESVEQTQRSPRAAWCARLVNAAGLLKEFEPQVSLVASVEECSKEKGKENDMLKLLAIAHRALLNNLSKSEARELRMQKICEAVGGAEVFRFDRDQYGKDLVLEGNVEYRFSDSKGQWVTGAR